MPNGLSGGFNISKARLQSILERFPPSENVAEFAESKNLDVTAGQMLEALRGYKPWFDASDDEVIVQQHYSEYYIVMLAPPPPATIENGVVKFTKLWFVVAEQSPILAELVDHHRTWLEQLAEQKEP